MQNTSFIFEEEKIFCEECYQNQFAQTCHACKKPIVGVGCRLQHFVLFCLLLRTRSAIGMFVDQKNLNHTHLFKHSR